MSDGNSSNDWLMPTTEELAAKQYDNTPLEQDDYICKIAKMTLKPEPTWNQATRHFDYSKPELQYKLLLLPYKPKTEDSMKDAKGEEVKPLTHWIWRSMNPFSLGMMPSGEPSFLRALIGFMENSNPSPENKNFKMPGGLVLDKANNIVTDENIIAAYRKQLAALRATEIGPEGFLMAKDGYKHIPDIRSYEGKYIGVRIIPDERGRNKVTGFSRVPSAFKPDEALETEAMAKFEEGYEKYIAKRKETEKNAVRDDTQAEVGMDGDAPLDTVEVEDAKF